MPSNQLGIGMAMGQGGPMMRSSLPSHMILSYLTPSLSLGALRSLAPPCNTLLLINFPTTITIFFLIKHISLIKIYLKLQINLSQQIKLIFSKNWLILSKCLTKQYHSKNKKSHNTKINDSIVYKLVSNKDKRKR